MIFRRVLVAIGAKRRKASVSPAGKNAGTSSRICLIFLAIARMLLYFILRKISIGSHLKTVKKRRMRLKYYFLFLHSAVLALACFSLRTRFLITLTAVHAFVTAVSLFYFVAVRKLNKPTPEKPNAKNGVGENHIN